MDQGSVIKFKMMEDAGEDVLRQKPSMVVSFFKRIGQVRQIFQQPYKSNKTNLSNADKREVKQCNIM